MPFKINKQRLKSQQNFLLNTILVVQRLRNKYSVFIWKQNVHESLTTSQKAMFASYHIFKSWINSTRAKDSLQACFCNCILKLLKLFRCYWNRVSCWFHSYCRLLRSSFVLGYAAGIVLVVLCSCSQYLTSKYAA